MLYHFYDDTDHAVNLLLLRAFLSNSLSMEHFRPVSITLIIMHYHHRHLCLYHLRDNDINDDDDGDGDDYDDRV